MDYVLLFGAVIVRKKTDFSILVKVKLIFNVTVGPAVLLALTKVTG